MITYIYALKDPETDEIRYVGKSNYPVGRLGGHIHDAKKKRSHKANWIRKILRQGKRPKLEILEEVLVENWPEREQWWIAKLRSDGVNLINKTDGGEGSCGLDAEISERISIANTGHTVSKKTREKLSRANRGREVPQELRDRISKKLKGIKRPPEVGKKISAAKIGYRYSEDGIRNLRLSHSKLSDDTIRDIRKMVVNGSSYSVVGARYNIGIATVSRIVNRKCYEWVV